MKKVLAIAAVAALTAGVSAYAANPFSDVTPNDWAYQAVEDLSEQGVVEGYPDGTFKGERNITRYEMAQIIARMLAKEDQLKVNDSTYVQGRLNATMDFKESEDDSDVQFDQLFANHDFGTAATVRLGRIPVAFGDQGGWLYGDSYGVDGAEAAFHLGEKVDVTAGYGRFNTSDYKTKVTDHDAFYARGAAKLGDGKLGVDYIKFVGDINDDNVAGNELLGANLTVPVSDFRVFGEYWKNTTTDSKYDTAWNAGIGYGKLNLKKPGSFAIDVAYNDVDEGIYFGGTGLQTDALKYLTKHDATNVTFWNAMADVTLQKNVFLHGEYAFDVSADDADINDKDAWTVSLNYKF